MRKGWTDKDANGKPLKNGLMAYFIDMEDGTRPIFTYGKSQDEILDKIATTAGTAQETLNRTRSESRPSASSRPANTPAQPQAAKPPLTADQQMVAVADLQNPAKASQAIVSLLESETGIDVVQLQRQKFADVAVAWRRKNPDFVDHPANMRLLTENAIRRAGGLGRVAALHLDAAYQELEAAGSLILADELASAGSSTPNPPQGQEGIPSGASARSATFATSYRSNALHAGPSQVSVQPRLKYTREQIMRMPSDEMARLIDDPDYIKAFDYWNSRPVQATA